MSLHLPIESKIESRAAKSIAGLALLSALLLSACSPIHEDGPIRMSGNEGTLCLPRIEGSALVLGGIILDTDGKDGVVVESVEFLESSNISVDQAYLVPMGSRTQLVGFVEEDAALERALAEAITIGPDSTPLDPEEDYNLVVIASPGSEDKASVSGFQLAYSVGSQSYTDGAPKDEVVVPAKGAACSDGDFGSE